MDARPECLTITVAVSVPWTGMGVNELEAAWLEAARRGLAASFRAAQSQFQRAHLDRLERRDWRWRHLQTQLGVVRVPMLKVRHRERKTSRLLGMDLFELAPRQRVTTWVERRGVELRVKGLSYRQAAATLCETTGVQLSAMSLWRRVQARGRQRCAEETATLAHAPPASAPSPDHLYLEADGIYVKAQRSVASSHEVKVGLSYTSRERVTGYRRRHRLAEKHLYGGVESFEDFGRRWYGTLERRHGVSRAEAILYLSDGEIGFRQLRETHFPHAIGQQDWAHVLRDLRAAVPDEARHGRCVAHLAKGRADLVRRSLRRQQGGSADARAKVLRALGEGDFYGWKRYRLLHDPDRTQRIPRATGGIEKNQEITIGRAMKKRGMAWTARGAHHLAKLIFAAQDTHTWNNLWSEPFPP